MKELKIRDFSCRVNRLFGKDISSYVAFEGQRKSNFLFPSDLPERENSIN